MFRFLLIVLLLLDSLRAGTYCRSLSYVNLRVIVASEELVSSVVDSLLQKVFENPRTYGWHFPTAGSIKTLKRTLTM